MFHLIYLICCRLICCGYIDDKDDYDNHNLQGRDSNFHVMFVGMAYVFVAFIYLAVTGELFAFVYTDDEDADVDSRAETNVSSLCDASF